MTKSEKLKHCSGCEQNFYNGNNPYGVKECWSLANMKLMKRKKVAMSQVPPWNQKPEKRPSCYQQKGYVFIDCSVTDRKY